VNSGCTTQNACFSAENTTKKSEISIDNSGILIGGNMYVAYIFGESRYRENSTPSVILDKPQDYSSTSSEDDYFKLLGTSTPASLDPDKSVLEPLNEYAGMSLISSIFQYNELYDVSLETTDDVYESYSRPT
jgi:hypothetical protein